MIPKERKEEDKRLTEDQTETKCIAYKMDSSFIIKTRKRTDLIQIKKRNRIWNKTSSE